MITIIFEHMTEKVIVIVNGNNVKFGNTAFGAVMADLSGLKLSKEGCLKEFPDLIGRDDWRTEAIKRFKDKISSLRLEEDKANFIIEDLRGHGYIPRYKQKSGFRAEVIR